MVLPSRYSVSMKQHYVSGKTELNRIVFLLLGLWASFFVLVTEACRYQDLPVVLHANLNENRTDALYGEGRSVAYTCERGFKVSSGTNRAVCLDDASGTLQWTSPTLVCVLEECGSPPDLFHAEKGRVEGRPPPYPVGSKAVYKCLSGYYKHEGTDTADCIRDSDGNVRWTMPTIDCRAENCGDPGQVRNAERSGHLFTHPHHVSYTCSRGYTTLDKAILYCLPGGVWSDRLPVCELVHCPILDDPANGQARSQDLVYQSVAVYSCSSGYLLIGDRERHCTSFGNWSGTQPICSEVHCKPFTSLKGGEVVYGKNLTKPGSIVLMKCYEPNERKTLKCKDTGEWNTEPLVCDEPVTISSTTTTSSTVTTPSTKPSTTPSHSPGVGTKCEYPGDIHHGSLKEPRRDSTNFPPNVNLTFQCDQGYKLKGDATLHCQSNGQWKPSRLPACDKIVPMSLIIGLTIGILFLVILVVVVAVVLVRKRKNKAQDALGLKRKANSIDARDSEETHCLERDKKPIPVTSL